MPISKENAKLYPADWPAISAQVKLEAAGKCEICDAQHGRPHPVTGSKVVLTTAHLDHNPRNNKRENLLALCQRCHNRIDRHHRKATRNKTRRDKARLKNTLTKLYLSI
jgi:5-methylcytosine-specific restriction endonuclease McrA